MPDAHVAHQAVVLSADQDLVHQAHAAVVLYGLAVENRYARGLLSAVLDHAQRLLQLRNGIALQGHADDAAEMIRTVILQGSYLERQWVLAQLYVLIVVVLP